MSKKKIVFTDTMIKKLRPEDQKYIRSEGNGFTVRVLPSGVKTWLYLYNIEGKRREMNLGNYPDVSLEKAREKFEHAKKILKNGIDPLIEKKEAAEEIRDAYTVAELIDDYIKKHAMKFKKLWQEDERILRKELLNEEKTKVATEKVTTEKETTVWIKRAEKSSTDWSNRKAADITKRDATLLLESIVDRGTPAMSNQVLKIVRKMFNFAVERDILQHTPFTGVKALAPNTSRERTLSENEIMTFWGSLNSSAISPEIQSALKLVLITAQRPGEVSGMHTREINEHWWTIPAERSKNGKEHRVYLTSTALDIINAAIEDNQKGLVQHNLRMKKEKKPELPVPKIYNGYIFPCPHRDKEQSIASHALPVAVRRNLAWPLYDKKGKPLRDKSKNPITENRLGVGCFTPHDLRRTAATFMGKLGFMDEIIDAVLNHVKQGIIKTYNRHNYDTEKQLALQTWEGKLLEIVSTEKNIDPTIDTTEQPEKA